MVQVYQLVPESLIFLPISNYQSIQSTYLLTYLGRLWVHLDLPLFRKTLHFMYFISRFNNGLITGPIALIQCRSLAQRRDELQKLSS